MNEYETIFNMLQEKVDSGEITLEFAESVNDKAFEKYYSESFTKSPLKDKLEDLKKIKDAKPSEFDSDNEIKDFVDKNYDKIEKASDLLQKEPEKLTKDDNRFLVSTLLSMLGYAGGAALMISNPIAGITVACISWLWLMISSITWSIIRSARTNADTEAMKNLSKVKTALTKLNTKKLPDNYKKKVSKLIQAIDDAETDIYAKIKNVKESAEEAYDNTFEFIQESVDNGEMSLEEAKEMNTTAYDKIFYEASAEDKEVTILVIGGAVFAGIFVGIFAKIIANVIKINKAGKQIEADCKKAKEEFAWKEEIMNWSAKLSDLMDYHDSLRARGILLEKECKNAEKKAKNIFQSKNSKEEAKKYLDKVKSDCDKVMDELEKTAKELESFIKNTPHKYVESGVIKKFDMDTIISCCEDNIKFIDEYKKKKTSKK